MQIINLKIKITMIMIEKSLYEELTSTGVQFNEKDLIIIPDHKSKRGLIEFNPLTETKRRKKLREEEKRKVDSIPSPYLKPQNDEYFIMKWFCRKD